MDRRRLLQSFAAGAALSALPVGQALARVADGTPTAAFHALLDKISQDMLLSDPEFLTMLGIIIGIGAVITIITIGDSLTGAFNDEMSKFGARNITLEVRHKGDPFY